MCRTIEFSEGLFQVSLTERAYMDNYQAGDIHKNGKFYATVYCNTKSFLGSASPAVNDGNHVINISKELFDAVEIDENLSKLTILHEIGHCEKRHYSRQGRTITLEVQADEFVCETMGFVFMEMYNRMYFTEFRKESSPLYLAHIKHMEIEVEERINTCKKAQK